MTVSPTHPRGSARLRALACLLSLLALGCATTPDGPREPDLDSRISDVVDVPPLDQVHWGILAVDAESGRRVYARNAAKKFVPASNMKLLTTSVALTMLGPDFRFETALWAAGPVDDEGILDGDLVLVGTGDPTLSDRYHDSFASPLEALADSLRAAGVRRVDGRLVVDASAWDSTAVPGSWMVANLPWRYAATGGPFAVAEGELHVEVTGGADVGDTASVSWWPRGEGDFVVSRLETVAADSGMEVRPRYLPESRRLELEGRVPRGETDTLRIAARSPVVLAGHVLRRTLERSGIAVEGGLEIVRRPGEPLSGACVTGGVTRCGSATKVAALSSPPLSEIVRGILEPSQNWMTEQLVRSLGDRYGSRGGWDEGLDVVEDVLVRVVGVDSLDLSLRDGSGLSAYNLVTPRAVVRILDFMARSEHREVFRRALAAPGEEGSTLESRLETLEGSVQAKTGTISHVNALSGYLERPDGSLLYFSVLTNGSGLPSGTVRDGIDRVVEALAGF